MTDEQHLFRTIMGRFATGVTIVTTHHEEELHGLTVNSFASVSLDPLLILINIAKSARSHALILKSRTFAVNILAVDQRELSVLFSSSKIHDRFSHCFAPRSPLGNPYFPESLAVLEVERAEVVSAGDHSIFLGQVTDQRMLHPEKSPLLYYGGNYATVQASAVGEPLSQVPRG